MSDRILNFSEFFTKYSKDATDDKASLDNLTGAAANFEEGFDKDTYDQAALGPKKPISQEVETTPAQPGENGAPGFTTETEEDMVAPEEKAEPTEEEGTGEESEEKAEEKEESTPEPETGANPKKKEEKVEEGLIMGFSSFINEESDFSEILRDEDFYSDEEDDSLESEEEELLGANPFKEDEMGYTEDEMEHCELCGEPIYHTIEGASCGCNM